MIYVSRLTKKYTNGSGEITAVDGIDLTLGETGLTFILGKSGCGKTTLLNLLGTLDQPDEGEVQMVLEAEGEKVCYDYSSCDEDKLDYLRNTVIGFVFQEFFLIDGLTVEQNLKLVLEQQENGEPDEAEIDTVLEYVDMKETKNSQVSYLSGGQKQRIAIARALIKKPTVILADEPTGDLDAQNGESVIQLLKKASESCLVVVVSHDEDLANRYANRILRMRDGVIISDVHKEIDTCEIELIDKLNGNRFVFESREEAKKELGNVVLSSEKELYEFQVKKHIKKRTEETVNKSTFVEKKTCHLSTQTILKLSVESLKVKKLRLLLTMITILVVLSFLLIVGYNERNNVGTALSEYNSKMKEKLVQYSRMERVETEYFTEQFQLNRSSGLKEALVGAYGEENVVHYINNYMVYSEENAILCVLSDFPVDCYTMLFGSEQIEGLQVVITDCLSNQIYGKENSVGEKLTIFDRTFTVSGVVRTDYKTIPASSYSRTSQQQYEYENYCNRVFLTKESIMTCLRDQEELTIEASDPFVFSMLDYLEVQETYGNASQISETDLLLGRLPQNANEIVVSESYARNNAMLTDEEELQFSYFEYQDIKSVFGDEVSSEYINLHEYLEYAEVVGVVGQTAATSANIWVAEGVFQSIQEEYLENLWFTGYEVVSTKQLLDGKTQRQLYDKEICDLNPDVQSIINLFHERDTKRTKQLALELVLFCLFVFLIVLFFSYNIRDNERRIGIYRALGVAKKDIIHMYLLEALLVFGSAYLLAYVCCCLYYLAQNKEAMKMLGILTKVYHHSFGWELVCVIVCLFCTLGTVIIPIKLQTEKKPINQIRGK